VAGGNLVADRMLEALRHRGPDGHGVRTWPGATLVHTRLSIIDLSPAGTQPMSNEDGTIWTVFNGEIYNHHELRKSLEARGHMFKGHADTEVLPHLYEEEGPEFVKKLRGMFALAIYDARTQTLMLARDRFGIKPLFYAAGKDTFAFASELRALLQFPGIDDRPNRQAIYDFAALFYIPAPETFYTGIRAVQPGEALQIRLNGGEMLCKGTFYHRWAISPDPAITLSEAADRADALVTAAVHRQVESDVPLGSLLSGGIDSSLVSFAAQAALGGGLRTFNVRFPDKQYDETWAAVSVANHIGSQHQTLDLERAGGSWDTVSKLFVHAGQPFADTSLLAVNAVCRLMRQHVTVALSGDGGDEGFGGYDFYWQIARIARLQTLPPVLWYGASLMLSRMAGIGAVPASLPQRLGELAKADDVAILENLFCWTRERERDLLFGHNKDLLPVRRWFEPQWEHHAPAKASRIEKLSMLATEANVRLALPNDFLFKVDTASMRESMEVRVPMLDEELFDFGLRLPHKLKVSGRTCKNVLRAVARRRLPPEIVEKPKWGFNIPVDKWVDAQFRSTLQQVLFTSSSKLSEFFEPAVYKPIIQSFCNHHPCPDISRIGVYQRAIMLLSVELALNNLHDIRKQIPRAAVKVA
jgi:asparagine synthase (glutamine-hydrolysing)